MAATLPPRLALLFTLPLLGFGAGLAGCNAEFCDIVECTGAQGGQGGGAGGSTSTGEGGTIDPGCIPSMLSPGSAVPPECGVFVDENANGDGSQASPLRRLDDAFEKAVQAGTPDVVYVCGSPELAGPFTMRGGVSIFGGLACGTWTYDPTGNRPKIVGVANQPAFTVEEEGASRIEDLAIEAPDGEGDGASSLALSIHLADVSIARCTITAGQGQAGASGASPPGGGMAPSGMSPQGCMLNINGGPGGLHMCGANMTSTNGGNGGMQSAPDGAPGLEGSNNTSAMGGDGGTPAGACGAGQPGSGVKGDDGGMVGAVDPLEPTDFGMLGFGGFEASVAPAGNPGLHGGGGGGGRGGSCGGGAGGGAGGCGGPPGGGGQSGGASIAIGVWDGTLTLLDGVTLITADAGSGGPGGTGGAGEQGGASAATGTSTGCTGSAGGNGGPGGGGAGGNGGISALVFLQGPDSFTGSPAMATVGMGGALGTGGPGGPTGSDGLACLSFVAPGGPCTPAM